MATINMGSDHDDDTSMLNHEFPASLRSERILLASESLGPINGVSRTTTNLILSLQAQEVPLKLVAPYYTKSKSKSTQPPVDLGPIKRLGGAPLPYTPELTVAYPFRLDRICGKFKPTLIYLASPASVGFQVLFQLRALHNPPVVMANFQTDLSAYASIIFPPPLDKYCMWLLQIVQGWLYSHPCVHTIFYPSRPVRDYLVEAGVPEDRLVHLGRGVDTTVFNPIHRDITWRRNDLQQPSGKEIVLVSVGRLAPEKGFPFLASAVKKLALTGIPFCLLVVGGNRNASVEREIKQEFAALGAQRVRFTGFLEGEALARAYASADVFCHCSVTETFGLVVLEAMACGLPVIARDAGGPSEIVRDGVTGFLTAPEDEDGFVARIKQLSEDKDLRERMGIAARRQAEASTWDAINLRVARRMQMALDERRLNSARQGPRLFEEGVGSNSNTLNWILAFGGAVFTELKFTWAMSVVCFFWIIGVVPLLVHGNLMFSQTTTEPAQPEGRKKLKDDGGETGRATESSRMQWERVR